MSGRIIGSVFDSHTPNGQICLVRSVYELTGLGGIAYNVVINAEFVQCIFKTAFGVIACSQYCGIALELNIFSSAVKHHAAGPYLDRGGTLEHSDFRSLEHVVHALYIVDGLFGKLELASDSKRDLLTERVKEEGSLNADDTASNNYAFISDVTLLPEHGYGFNCVLYTGYGRDVGDRTDRKYHLVKTGKGNFLCAGIAIELDGDPGLLELPLHILHVISDVTLKVRSAGGKQLTAQLVCFFPYFGLHSADVGGKRGLHSAGASADDQHAPAFGIRAEREVVLMMCYGIYRAGIIATQVTKTQALIAAYAGTDVIFAVLCHLFSEVRIGDVLVAERDEVRFAILKHLLGKFGTVELALGYDGYVHGLLDGLSREELAALILVYRRYLPVPHLIAAGVDVKCVSAPLFQQLCDLNALFQLAVARGIHAMDRRELNDLREVLAAVALHSLYALAEEAHTIFKTSTVLIGAVVEGLSHELVGEITAVGVHLYRVGAGIFG